MSQRIIILEAASQAHKIGDILIINGERWIVDRIDYNGKRSRFQLIPLINFVASSTFCVQVPHNDFSIVEYLNKLCDQYEENGHC